MKVDDKIKELQKIKKNCGNIDLNDNCIPIERKINQIFGPIFKKHGWGSGGSVKIEGEDVRIFKSSIEGWDGCLFNLRSLIQLISSFESITSYTIRPEIKHNLFGIYVEIWVPLEEIK